MGSDTDKRPGPVEYDEVSFEEWMAAISAAADKVGAAIWRSCDEIFALYSKEIAARQAGEGE